MAASLPESLKSLNSYLKLAADTDSRDPVLAYWIRFFAVNRAMQLDRSSPDAVKFLTSMMDMLETAKAKLRENEAVTQDIVAQAHIENYATKLFDLADREDREANASLKTVKAYLAANQVFEVLSVFTNGLTEEVTEKQKYAKYRASLIMKAVKAGEPVPLPENLAGNLEKSIDEKDPFEHLNRGEPSLEVLPPADPCPQHQPPPQYPSSSATAHLPSPPRESQEPDSVSGSTASNGVSLSPLSLEKAQKFCKYAGSALLYDDVPTAIDNLEKALSLLKTGHVPQ